MGDLLETVVAAFFVAALLAGVAAVMGFFITLLTSLTMGPAFLISLGFLILLGALPV